jgi:Protein of unknown function (DUF2950)
MDRNENHNATKRTPAGLLLAVAALCLCVPLGMAHAADSPAKPGTAKSKSAAKPAQQRAFATPDALFQALADAAKANNSKTLVALLGKSGDALINSGDAVKDKDRAQNFAADYADKHSIVMNGDAKATLVVGKQDWPMPIPAVKGTRGWTLDAAAGTRELLARRIGQNELDAIEVVRSIVDAERDYASEDRDADGLRQYADKFISRPGKQGTPTPFHGYYFRLLTAQGKDAPGGARSYVAHGRLIGGFAVIAYPATYGNSGIMSFIVNQDGKVYQKDLGPNTIAMARAVTAYNPDSSWSPVK